MQRDRDRQWDRRSGRTEGWDHRSGGSSPSPTKHERRSGLDGTPLRSASGSGAPVRGSGSSAPIPQNEKIKKDNFVQVKRISIYTHLCDLFSRRPFFEVRRKIDIGTLCGLASIHTICCIVKHTQHCVLLHVHKHCLGHLTDAIYADSDGEATGLV